MTPAPTQEPAVTPPTAPGRTRRRPLHRTDLLSLALGLIFCWVALAALLPGLAVPRVGLVLPLLAVTAGAALVGQLVLGALAPDRDVVDVRARDVDPDGVQAAPPTWRPGAGPDEPPAPVDELAEDPVFGSPLTADELDRRYREAYGDTDP